MHTRMVSAVTAAAMLGFLAISPGALAASAPVYVGIQSNVQAVSSESSYLGESGAIAIDNQNVPLQLTNPEYYVVNGVLQSNGQYSYPFAAEAPPGETIASIEVGINRQSHTQLLEVGVPTTASLANLPQGGSQNSTTGAPSGTNGVTNGTATTASTASTSGYHEVVWHDPLQLSLAIVKDTVNFDYNGNSVSNLTGSRYSWWYSNDGWFTYNTTLNVYYQDLGGSQVGSAATSEMFQNNQFGNYVPTCSVKGDTYHVVNNEADGYQYGTVNGETNTYASGGCYGYLGYYTVTSGGVG